MRQGAKAVKWRSQIVIIRPHCQFNPIKIRKPTILTVWGQGDELLIQQRIEIENRSKSSLKNLIIGFPSVLLTDVDGEILLNLGAARQPDALL